MIPNNIILTWKDHTVPSYVFDNIKHLNPDKEIIFFEDKDCIKFLQETYGQSFVDHFNGETCGCHKADFFRYAYLYECGGYYTDIDIEYTTPISEFLPDNLEYFSIRSAIFNNHIFQAILYVRPHHEIVKNCLHDMLKYGPNLKNYPGGYKNEPPYTGSPVERMFQNFVSYYKSNDQSKMDLGQEVNTEGRYACVYNNRIIAWSRYETFNRECFIDWKES